MQSSDNVECGIDVQVGQDSDLTIGSMRCRLTATSEIQEDCVWSLLPQIQQSRIGRKPGHFQPVFRSGETGTYIGHPCAVHAYDARSPEKLKYADTRVLLHLRGYEIVSYTLR